MVHCVIQIKHIALFVHSTFAQFVFSTVQSKFSKLVKQPGSNNHEVIIMKVTSDLRYEQASLPSHVCSIAHVDGSDVVRYQLLTCERTTTRPSIWPKTVKAMAI